MGISIELKPVKATPEVMQSLEDMGLIIRMAPRRHELTPPAGATQTCRVYTADARFGPHILLGVTVDSHEFSAFGHHPDNEEFILIGDACAKPLYLLIAKMRCEELDYKISSHALTEDDFILLEARYNDPECSMFVMRARVPHCEATLPGPGVPPSFYVTEPGDMGCVLTDFKDYKLVFRV